MGADHADAPELKGDLDVLYRFVADELDVLLDGRRIYHEVEFPIVELAHALTSWLDNGLPQRRGITFTPSGAEDVALSLQPSGAGWAVLAEGEQGAELSEQELKDALGRFVADVFDAGSRAGVDVQATLKRLANYSRRRT